MYPAPLVLTAILTLIAAITLRPIVRYSPIVAATIGATLARLPGGNAPGTHRKETVMQGTTVNPTVEIGTPSLRSEDAIPEVDPLTECEDRVADLEARVATMGARLMAAHTAARGLAESLRVADNGVSAEWCQRQAQTLAEATYVWAKGE